MPRETGRGAEVRGAKRTIEEKVEQKKQQQDEGTTRGKAESGARLDPNSERTRRGGFSGEEHRGRYLDLVRFHHAFVADVARTFGVALRTK